MEKVYIKIDNQNYQIKIEDENFSFYKEGKGEVIVEQEKDCFDLKYKELNMPNLSFNISENGNYKVTFNSTINIPYKEIVVSNNEAIINIPEGTYTIDSIVFESNECLKTYNTPIEIDCPILPHCNCSGNNGGNFEILSITNVSEEFYDIQFDACNVSPFNWKIENESGKIVKEGSVTPTSSIIKINLSGLLNGNYILKASSTGCVGNASKNFSINNSINIITNDFVKLVSNQGDFEIRGDAYNLQKSSGIDVISYLDLHWGKIERRKDVYNFGEVDYLLNTLKEDGLKIILWFSPYHCHDTAIHGWDVHNEDGTTSFVNCNLTSYLPDTSWERDRYGRIGGINYNLNRKCKFTYSDDYAKNRYLSFVAKTIDYINKHENKDVIEGIGYIDGTYNETGFFTQSTNTLPNNTDLGYAEIDKQKFRQYLQNKYSNIGNLNNSWGVNITSFNSINIPEPPEYSNGNIIDYSNNKSTQDLFEFKVKLYKEFYESFVNVVKNPSSFESYLSNNTNFTTFAYITENFTSAQGLTWGVAYLKSMYSMFDAYLSSNTAGETPFHTNSYLGDLYLRQCTFLGTFSNKSYGFEKDFDAVEQGTGISYISSRMMDKGVKYVVVALQDTVEKLNKNVVSDDGEYRKLHEDIKRAKQLYFTNKKVIYPINTGILEYSQKNALLNPHNPENIKSTWIEQTNINSGNLSTIKLIKCND